MIEINGQCYYLDMDALMAWVSDTPSSEKNISTMTTLTYHNEGLDELSEKSVTESKNTLNDMMNNLRYDFVRMMVSTIVDGDIGDMDEMGDVSLNWLNFGQRLAFNTLLSKSLIKIRN